MLGIRIIIAPNVENRIRISDRRFVEERMEVAKTLVVTTTGKAFTLDVRVGTFYSV